MRFDGLVAIVTGGAQGIGYATAERLLSEGATVCIGDISFKNRESLNKNSRGMYEGYLDVTDPSCVESFVNQCRNSFGGIDILVNNAGISHPALPFEDVPRKNWDKIFEVNIFGVVNCTNAVIPIMKAQKSGKIVNLASLGGQRPAVRGEVTYCVSKSAVISMTWNLAKQLGPYNINVNSVSPGFIRTPMGDSLAKPDLSGVPLGRQGDVSEIAAGIAFLASPDASYITGVTLDINGGVLMR